MALVHEKLYQSKDMAHIHFADYLRSLAMYLFHFWQVDEDRIRLDLKIANILLDVNTAIPLGLIINELISNALEHAFPDGRVGEIRVRLIALDPGRFELVVEDDGVGLPPGFDVAAPRRSASSSSGSWSSSSTGRSGPNPTAARASRSLSTP